MQRKKPAEPAPVVVLADRRCQRADRASGTLREAWDVYLASQALAQLKASSRPVYAQAAREALAALPPRPTRGDVTLWLEAMVRDGRSPATANKLLRALKSITERATLVSRGAGMPVRNAFRAVKPFRLAARERRDASHETVRRLLVLARTVFERFALRLAAFYGLRCGELLGLRPEDVRHDPLRLVVVHTRDTYGLRPRKNAMAGTPHVLTLDDGETAGMLLSLCRESTRLELAHRSQRELAREWLIPWGHDHPRALMARWRQDPEVTLPRGDGWHALRHYGATQLAAQVATLVEIQAWLGDSTPTAAMTYMGQVRGTTQGGAARVLRAFEDKKGGESETEAGGATARDASQSSRDRHPPLGFSSHLDGVHSSNLMKGKNREKPTKSEPPPF